MMGRGLLLCLCIGITFAAVAKKDRVIDPKLSEAEPGSPEYDHDAFVGHDVAEEFDNLSPEESKRRLKIIAEKIDKNSNGFVTLEELKDWIVFTQKRYIREDTLRQFHSHDQDGDKLVKWEEYYNNTYGYLTEDDLTEDNEGFSYSDMIARDKNRFAKADVDENGFCSEEEFQAFLHPEEFDHMKNIVAKETLEDIDKDKDGFVSVEEYIGDMYSSENEDEPSWISDERKQFSEYRDVNKDGHLDIDEVSAWILPDGYDHADAEARHLIYESDEDTSDGEKDGQLSIDEIVSHYDNFVGSQVTDFGDALKRHDEF